MRLWHEAHSPRKFERASVPPRRRGVSLQEVAETVGMTRGALYRYFPSREALVREAFARGFDSSKRALEEVLEQSGSPLQLPADRLDPEALTVRVDERVISAVAGGAPAQRKPRQP